METRIDPVRGENDVAHLRRLCREAVFWEIDAYPDHRAAIIAHFQPDTLDERLSLLPGDFAPPSGQSYLARLEGAEVGCVMWRAVGEGRAEMARLFVDPAARGHGLGAALVERVAEDAGTAGCTALRFVTARHLESAVRLYRAAGFTEVPPWREIDPATAAQILFMERGL